MQTDPLADFLTQIRNANTCSKPELTAPYSRMKSDVARILKEEGFIKEVELTKVNDKPALRVVLSDGKSNKTIRGIKRVSKPGLRRYAGSTEIPRVLGGLGVAIISTSKGVLSGHQARKFNVGGEVLCYIW
jgi:small subunit ribosomal protein S8